MDINEFIASFAEEFVDTEAEEFSAATEFKQLEEWESIVAIQIMAMVARNYDVMLTGLDIKDAVTIEDLFSRVCELKAKA